MKSLHWRLTLWFAISLLVVVGGLMVAAHWHLNYELHQEKWERTHPANPDLVLHGSFTDREVHDILAELAEFWLMIAVPLVGMALGAAYFIARRSTRPVQQINQQLDCLDVATLSKRIEATDADPEIGQLVGHFNKLLDRIEVSFTHLQDYTAQVAHELRTPLQLLRLRIESEAAALNPELAEELQEEIARLSNYVQTALVVAQAEQGRLELAIEVFALKPYLTDMLEPFSRLALTENRQLVWSCPDHVVVAADRGALKQIIFNLLNNALKHGVGNIQLRVRATGNRLRLVVGNRTAPIPQQPATGLGIGLRLVSAFAQQMPGTKFHFRRGAYFWSRLVLPTSQNGVNAGQIGPSISGTPKHLKI